MKDSLLGELKLLCKFCVNADDLVRLVEARSRSALERTGEQFIAIAYNWMVGMGVNIMVDKTGTIMHKDRLSPVRPLIVRVNGVRESRLQILSELGYPAYGASASRLGCVWSVC